MLADGLADPFPPVDVGPFAGDEGGTGFETFAGGVLSMPELVAAFVPDGCGFPF